MPNFAKSQLRLTEFQRRELERKCSSGNWTDGGHWNGRGPEPKCWLKDTVSNKLSHTFHFPTDEAANKWNRECEKAIRYGGHLATAGITVTVGLVTGGTMAPLVTGIAAAIAKDEVQANIAYPRMSRGWSYELTTENRFTWSPYARFNDWFKQTITGICRDWQSKVIVRNSSTVTYTKDDLPETIAIAIASAPSRSKVEDYV